LLKKLSTTIKVSSAKIFISPTKTTIGTPFWLDIAIDTDSCLTRISLTYVGILII
jgi:hypothetical protein